LEGLVESSSSAGEKTTLTLLAAEEKKGKEKKRKERKGKEKKGKERKRKEKKR
jgi:hypothetical protein